MVVKNWSKIAVELQKVPGYSMSCLRGGVHVLKNVIVFLLSVAIEYTQHLIEQKATQEKKLEELRKEVLALKIMKS